MAKYLIKARYAPGEGAKGLLADGGSARVKAIEQVVAAVGGKVEAHYFAFGDVDAYTIIDLPDDSTVVALTLTVNASGLATAETVQLLTPEELDAAVKKAPKVYDAPGPNA